MSAFSRFSPAPAGATQMPAETAKTTGAEEAAVEWEVSTSLDSRLYRHVRAILCLSLLSGISATSAGFLFGLGSPWLLPVIFFMAAAFALGMARGAGDSIFDELEGIRFEKRVAEEELIVSRVNYLELYSEYMALRQGPKWQRGAADGHGQGVSPSADVIFMNVPKAVR